MWVTAHHDMTIAVKVALNLNATNQRFTKQGNFGPVQKAFAEDKIMCLKT